MKKSRNIKSEKKITVSIQELDAKQISNVCGGRAASIAAAIGSTDDGDSGQP